MNNLIIPKTPPRVGPLAPEAVNAYVKSEYDKSVNTWGIPNNLIRTMGWLPRLALTEVDYANSFIFDSGTYSLWPRPGDPKGAPVLFPEAGFVDRVTKELVINVVSLLNRSRYSITHHSLIGYNTLVALLPETDANARAKKAEEMLLYLVDSEGQPAFEGQNIYSEFHLHALRLAVKLRGDAHSVTDQEFTGLRSVMSQEATRAFQNNPILKEAFAVVGNPYLHAYVNAMLVELTWCIVHFAGLLNKWFTVLQIMDETSVEVDGIDFVSAYNATVPDPIKTRNNNLLGKDGWGRQ
ncbi:MAG: hypothetical protein ABL962_13030 [Fimbriimonadaceae bacterium]